MHPVLSSHLRARLWCARLLFLGVLLALAFSLPAQEAPSGTADPPAEEPSAAESIPDETAAVDVETEEPTVEAPAPMPANALQRQSASVQRQLGRARRGSDGFFVSQWFSDNPVDPQASTGTPAPPADCDPLDSTIAEAFMRESATREGVSLDLVREVVRRESGFHPCAVSPKGAIGMMQLMPDTAESLGVADPFDARANIDGGVRFLRRLLDKYKGRPDLALAAYNAGEGAVDKANGVPDFTETREYVNAIMQKVFEAPRDRPTRQGISGRGIQRNAPLRNTPPRIAPPQAPTAKSASASPIQPPEIPPTRPGAPSAATPNPAEAQPAVQ